MRRRQLNLTERMTGNSAGVLSLSPMLDTEDLPATVDFYTRVLDFNCVSIDRELGWASLWRDQVNIMISLPNAHLSWGGCSFTGSLYLYSDDVDSEWSRIHRQVEICYPIQTFDYGMREFAFYDNNRYLLKFGQPTVSDNPTTETR